MKILGHPRGNDRRVWWTYATAVGLLVLVSLIAQGACLPHTHIGVEPGVYNADHDLTLLAISGTIAPLAPVPVFFVAVVTGTVVFLPPPSPVSALCRDAESRAPPTA
jgi:hypothetical protein